MDTFLGYRRDTGCGGIRNYVLVISLVQCANSTAQKIAQRCDVPAITIDTGCGEAEEQAQKTNLGLIRAGQHPNVYGVLLVSLGCQWIDPRQIRREIEQTGKPVEHLCIQEEQGMYRTIEKGVEVVTRLQQQALQQPREALPLSQLVVSLNSGGSDWTSAISANTVVGVASDLIIERGGSVIGGGVRGMPGDESYTVELAVNHRLGCQILDMVEEYCEDLYRLTGERVSDINPTPGNKAGGITTLAEKAIGNSKMQGTAPLQGLLSPGDLVPYPGAWFLDERHGGNDTYLTTAFAMCHAQLMLFTTGKGTPQGNAVMPLVKITGNPETERALGQEIIDYSSGAVLEGALSIPAAGEELYKTVLAVAGGRLTKAELFGDYSYLIPPGTKI